MTNPFVLNNLQLLNLSLDNKVDAYKKTKPKWLYYNPHHDCFSTGRRYLFCF